MNQITNPIFQPGEHPLTITGPVGQLELLVNMPSEDTQSIVSIICHPHPLFGGTMHNKVVYTLARVFKELNIPTVRFNFRGVGSSAGVYDKGIGETDDLLAVVNWVKVHRPQAAIWLAGFSFGSFVAARAAKTGIAERLICVAPPVENFSFVGLDPMPCPWWVVQGDQDEVVAPQAVYDWLASLSAPPEVIHMSGATHFFHGKLVELRELLVSALKR